LSAALDLLVLRRDLTAPVPVADWPEGVALVALDTADAPAIHALLQRAYANGFGGVAPDWLDWWEALRADSEFDRDLCFVAKAGDEIVGFCLCWTSSFVKDLVVAPESHGRGVGAALLATAMAVFEGARCRRRPAKSGYGQRGRTEPVSQVRVRAGVKLATSSSLRTVAGRVILSRQIRWD
jgi:GNAT superfamily N-acetyltransferase